MQRFKQKEQGITLFAVILFLIVASLIAVAGIKYMKRQTEMAAAQLFGQELFTFGQAIHHYIVSSESLYTIQGLPGPTGTTYNPAVTRKVINNNVTLIAVGVAWLQKANAGVDKTTQQPFLDDNFSFATGLAPLILATPNTDGSASSVTGDATMTTVITYDLTKPDVPPKINITSGVLYEQPTQTGNPLIIKPDLTVNAVQRANTMYSPSQGVSLFTFSVPYIDNQGKYNLGAPTTGSTNTTPPNSAYLMVEGVNNGGNSMQGELSFTTTGGGKINNVGLITMQAPSGGIAKIDFPNQGQISNLTQLITLGSKLSINNRGIVFPVSGPPSTVASGNYIDMGVHPPDVDAVTSMITGLVNLNFDTSTSSNITGLQNLSFANTPATGNTPVVGAGQIQYLAYSNMFKGLKISAYSLDQATNSPTTTKLGSHNVCFLSGAIEGVVSAETMCVVDGHQNFSPYGSSTLPLQFFAAAPSDLAQAGLSYPQPTTYYLHRSSTIGSWCYAVCLDWDS